jgi:hypothetical protein
MSFHEIFWEKLLVFILVIELQYCSNIKRNISVTINVISIFSIKLILFIHTNISPIQPVYITHNKRSSDNEKKRLSVISPSIISHILRNITNKDTLI